MAEPKIQPIMGMSLSVGLVMGLSGVVLMFTALSEILLMAPRAHEFASVGIITTIVGLGFIVAGWSVIQHQF